MKESFPSFLLKRIQHFGDSIFNLFLFLPYYFAILQLLETYFAPWKNLSIKKSTPGFSFAELTSRINANTISRLVGMTARGVIIASYFFTQLTFVIVVPVWFVTTLLFSPIAYVIYMFSRTREEIKNKMKEKFMQTRILDSKNNKEGEKWFEIYWDNYEQKTDIFSKKNLFTTPPLARDWNHGYTPTLDKFASPYQSYNHHIKGRPEEIEQIERIFSKSGHANVIVVGEEGVGKNTLIEEFAQKIQSGQTNHILAFKRVIILNMDIILASSQDKNQKELLLKSLLDEARNAQNIILVIPHLHTYLSPDSPLNISTLLSEYLDSQDLQILSTSTPFFYEKYIRPNEQINALFEKVELQEMMPARAAEIIQERIFDWEDKWKVVVPYETIQKAIETSEYYITDIPFPTKAIDLLDEAASYAVKQKTDIVKPDFISIILSAKTHIPLVLNPQIKAKLLHLEDLLQKKVLHQEKAISQISNILRGAFVSAGKKKKPMASFLFLGPTGIGKTETAKAISETIFGTSDHLMRFDMSFYQTKKDIEVLLGSQNGNPGLMSSKIRATPYGVLLLDEIEKAEHDLLNIFLTLLDEAYFTDGFGKRVDCKNLVVIATSNAASDYITKLITENEKNEEEKITQYLIDHKLYSPEFLNRFDGVITFSPLTEDSIDDIARTMIDQSIKKIYEMHQINLTVSPAFSQNLIAQIKEKKEFGVRNLKRHIDETLEGEVAKQILANNIQKGRSLQI